MREHWEEENIADLRDKISTALAQIERMNQSDAHGDRLTTELSWLNNLVRRKDICLTQRRRREYRSTGSRSGGRNT